MGRYVILLVGNILERMKPMKENELESLTKAEIRKRVIVWMGILLSVGFAISSIVFNPDIERNPDIQSAPTGIPLPPTTP